MMASKLTDQVWTIRKMIERVAQTCCVVTA
jgi:hypothetical protein